MKVDLTVMGLSKKKRDLRRLAPHEKNPKVFWGKKQNTKTTTRTENVKNISLLEYPVLKYRWVLNITGMNSTGPLTWGFFNGKYQSTIWFMIEWICVCRRTMYGNKGLTISYKQIFNYVRISAPVPMPFKNHLYINNCNKKYVGSSV